ncbi:hypothetical protein GCM10027346_05960 [Hymenobacter seoulensis]
MKNLVLGGILLLSTWGGLTRIHDRNEAVQQGAQAFARKDYTTAAAAYKKAAITLGAKEDAVWLNLAHATAQTGRTAEAQSYYSRLSTSKSAFIRSVALQQLASLAAGRKDFVQALSLLRQALLANPTNSDARQNYELLRDYLARQAKQPQLPPPPPGTDGGPQQQEQQTAASRAGADQKGQLDDPTQPQNPRNASLAEPDATGQRNPRQPSSAAGSSANGSFRPGAGEQRSVAQGQEPGSVRGLSQQETGEEATGGTSRRGGTEAASNAEANMQTQRARLQQMNISTGQARQILDALQATERQYLQQLPRKATKPKEKDMPGW